MASKQLKEDMIRAIKGTVRLVMPSAKERAAFRFNPIDPGGADVAQAVAEEEKNRRLLAARATSVALPPVAASSSASAPAPAAPLAKATRGSLLSPEMRDLAARLSPRPLEQAAPRTATPGPVIPEPDPLAPKPGDMLARRIEFAKELKGQVSSGKYDQEGARKKASELGITPEDFGRFAKRELWPTPTPTPTPKPAPAAPTVSPDLIAARASFGRQLDQQSMSGGFNLEDAQRDAAALSITPEQFNAFVAARKPLSQMRAQQERQQVEAIGSSSALNLRRGLQTEAGRMRSVGRQVGRDIKRGMDPEFARQAGLLKMTTPGIRSVDQGIAEREGQEKTAAAFQANENQYAKLMQDADTDPDLKRKLDRMLAKRAKKAA